MIAALLQGGKAAAQDAEPLRLKAARELAPRVTQGGDRVPTFVRGDRIEGMPDRDLTLIGDAELRRGGLVLRAATVRFQQVDGTLDAQGNVELETSAGRYRGPELHYDLDTERGHLGPGEYHMDATGGRGTASLTEFAGRDLVRMRDARYTTCPVDDNSWFVKARELTIDNSEQEGIGRDATVVFKDVPIMALPYMRFAVGEERKSGFLTPGLGMTTARGFEVVAPYYWDIAPNRDATLIPRFFSKRGLQLGSEFRYLEPSYKGSLALEYLPNDNQLGTDRWSLLSRHEQGFSGGIGGYWSIQRVSDNNYLSDFSRSVVTAANRQLTQEGQIGIGRTNWNAALRVQKFQVLQDPAAPLPDPYERVPQLTVNAALLDRYGLDLNLQSEVTRFAHKTEVTGSRAVVIPSLSYPLILPGAYLTPKVAANLAAYELDRDRVGPGSPLDASFRRAVPTMSLDSGLTFERPLSVFGRDFLQTLEPRLFYVYTPYRKQNGAPLFDTAEADFNFAQLFSENRYSGQDRIADANQVTAAVSSRLIDPATGLEEFRAVLGQRFYFEDQRVSLGANPLSTSSKTDVLIGASGNLTRELSAEAMLQYDASKNRAFKSNLGARWTPEPGKVLNFNYRFIRDQLEQYDVSGQWRFSRSWVGVGRVNYSTLERRLVEGLAGVEYDGGCWVFRVVAHRYVTAAQTSNTSVFLQLELNGFASVGSSPLDALRRNIPGYQPVNAQTSGPARFVQYE